MKRTRHRRPAHVTSTERAITTEGKKKIETQIFTQRRCVLCSVPLLLLLLFVTTLHCAHHIQVVLSPSHFFALRSSSHPSLGQSTWSSSNPFIYIYFCVCAWRQSVFLFPSCLLLSHGVLVPLCFVLFCLFSVILFVSELGCTRTRHSLSPSVSREKNALGDDKDMFYRSNEQQKREKPISSHPVNRKYNSILNRNGERRKKINEDVSNAKWCVLFLSFVSIMFGIVQ